MAANAKAPSVRAVAASWSGPTGTPARSASWASAIGSATDDGLEGPAHVQAEDPHGSGVVKEGQPGNQLAGVSSTR